jgi:hypothetical protein
MSQSHTTYTTANRWRNADAEDSPAGALYTNGMHSIADMIGKTGTGSGKCGTVCSGSRTRQCC